LVREALLDVLRPVIGVDDLPYADTPVKFPGGFFTENHGFRLANVPDPWDRHLVLRLFPAVMTPEAVRCEVETQRAVSDQHYPCPTILVFDEQARLLDRQFVVMEWLPGVPLLGGIGLGTLIRRGPRLLGALARTTAEVQTALHALDPEPLLAALDGTLITVERWFDFVEKQIDIGATGLSEGLNWVVDNRPPDGDRRAICHGDLHAGNILVQGRHVTGVIDWTAATVAQPALDVGFTTMSLDLAPVEAPPPLQRAIARFAQNIARRYVRHIQRMAPTDLNSQQYYEALRCLIELANVAAYRLESAGGPTDRPRPSWDRIGDAMVVYFGLHTGVKLHLPEAG
jgi:aminoglycoside phosphotransferase (APT) family kinase protein